MSQKALPTPREFRTKVKEWQLHVSFTPLPQQQITFSLKTKNQKQLHYKQTYCIDNLPHQIKQNYFKEVYYLCVYLQQQANRGIKIYDFVAEQRLLRFAYRQAKKVFSLKLKKFVNGVEQREDGKEYRQSQRYSANLNRVSVRQSVKKGEVKSEIVRQQAKPPVQVSVVNHLPTISETKQQQQIHSFPQPAKQSLSFLPIKTTTQTLHYPELKQADQPQQDPELDYFYDLDEQQQPKTQLKFTQQQDIDYDSWINTIQDNGSQIFLSKVVPHKVEDYLVDDDDEPNPYDLKRKIVHSEIIHENQPNSDQQVFIKENKNSIDFKQVVKENIQLRHQRNQLLEKVKQLELENQSLKQQLSSHKLNTTCQQTIPRPPFPNMFDTTTQAYSNNFNNNNLSVSHGFLPFSQGPNSFQMNSNPMAKSLIQTNSQTGPKTVSPFFQLIQQTLNKGDEWQQQYTNNKRPFMRSKFSQYLDLMNQKLEICDKSYTLDDFDDNFFPFDWSHVKILNLDGNMLMTQGFDKVISNLWPNITEISAGYNSITDVLNLEKLPNLTKIDLRANPLTEFTKNYLESLKKNRKIQILY